LLRQLPVVGLGRMEIASEDELNLNALRVAESRGDANARFDGRELRNRLGSTMGALMNLLCGRRLSLGPRQRKTLAPYYDEQSTDCALQIPTNR